jgi:hypothetical protein
MDTQAIAHHDGAQEQDGVHRPVFYETKPPDPFDVADRDLPHDDRAQAVSQDDDRDRKCEGECAQDAVYGKCHVDDFQVEDLAQV